MGRFDGARVGEWCSAAQSNRVGWNGEEAVKLPRVDQAAFIRRYQAHRVRIGLADMAGVPSRRQFRPVSIVNTVAVHSLDGVSDQRRSVADRPSGWVKWNLGEAGDASA